MVVTDLDGTVVRADGTISASTVEAANQLQRLGIPLVVATARTPAGVAAVEHLPALTTFAVCCTGALGWSPATREIGWTQFIGAETVERIALALSGLDRAGIGSFDGHRWSTTPDYRGFGGRMPSGPWEVVSWRIVAETPACAMAVRMPSLSAPAIADQLVAAGVTPEHATLTWAATDLLDIVPPGVDKAVGVSTALQRLGLTWDQAVAMGDMPNDVPMLRAAGVGVAVGRAHPTVRAAADLVVDDVDHDGFAAALRQLGMLFDR